MSIEDRLRALEITLPEPPKPGAVYVPYRIVGDLVYISGQDCRINGELEYQGKVGREVSEAEAYKAARTAAINALAVLKSAIGSLENVKQVVNLHGYVNSAEGFVNQPYVINGASELLIEIFGERGKHSRCALGNNELPFGTCVEIEMIVEVKQDSL